MAIECSGAVPEEYQYHTTIHGVVTALWIAEPSVTLKLGFTATSRDEKHFPKNNAVAHIFALFRITDGEQLCNNGGTLLIIADTNRHKN